MTVPTYRFAVFGLGRRGRYHMESLESMTSVQARCVAVADPREPTPAERARFGRSFYQEYRQLLTDVHDLDFVLIASFCIDHPEQALAVLQRGIPVFLEKAVAFSWDEAVHLYQQVMRHQYPIFIGYNLRRFPATLAMKRLLDAGQLGRVQSILGHVNSGSRWSHNVWAHYQTPPASSVIVGKLTHDTDTMQHCLQAEAVDCTATITRNVWLETVDGCATVEGDKADSVMVDGDACCISGLLSNGAIYTVQLTTAGPDYERRYMVNGTEGQLEVVMHSARPGHPGASVHLWRNGEKPQEIKLPPAIGGHGGADFRIHRDFMAWLQSKPTTPADPRSILTGMVIPTAALDSMATGQRIDCAARLRQAAEDISTCVPIESA